MRYAGWKKVEDQNDHEEWFHENSNTTVSVYRYGVKSYLEINLGTGRVEVDDEKFEFSEHEDAIQKAFHYLDSIQSAYRTSERLEEEELGDVRFLIERTDSRYSVLKLMIDEPAAPEIETYYEYVTDLLNHFATNHYFEGLKDIRMMEEEPFSMSESELKEERAKVKQEIKSYDPYNSYI